MVFALPPRPKPRVLQCFKHFFSQKMQPNARKWRFSPPEMVLWLEFWGSPSTLKVLQRPVFELIVKVFNEFEALKRAQKRPKTQKTHQHKNLAIMEREAREIREHASNAKQGESSESSENVESKSAKARTKIKARVARAPRGSRPQAPRIM